MHDNELHNLADTLGITLTTHTQGAKGYYHHPTRTISLRTDLRAANYRCTLAHELAHALNNDTPTTNPHYHQRQEHQADKQAAEWLINPRAVRTASLVTDGSPQAIARELGVTLHLLHVWARSNGISLD